MPKLVAAYIHDGFYSKTARARNKPPRVELSRLTVRQYRNAVADLIGSFREPSTWDGKARGLKAEYYKSKQPRGGNRAIDRVDPVVKFDFGTEAPAPDKFDPKEFSIVWQGSVLAPETGEYEFVVRTENSIKLCVNDMNRPLIDAWVKSGNDTEYPGFDLPPGGPGLSDPARVLEGQAGRRGLEGEEGQGPVGEGVDRPRVEAARIGRPRSIPARYLSPARLPESFVPLDAVPARRPEHRLRARDVDLEGVGPGHDRRRASRWPTTSPPTSRNWPALGGSDGPERYRKLRDFCRQVRRAGVPPPARLLSRRTGTSTASSPRVATRRRPSSGSILLVLKSPRFLYREVDGLDAYDVALALSFGLWDSPPDKALLEGRGRGAARQSRRGRSARPSGWSTTPGPGPRSASSSSSGSGSSRSPTWPRTPRSIPGSTPRSPPTSGRRSTSSSTTWSGATRPTSASSSWPTRSTSTAGWPRSTGSSCRPMRRSRRSRSTPRSGRAC